MPRLGEHLVAAGLTTADQVERALRAQVLWGGRLGTNLVELHFLELDPLSTTLGRQHRLPAALAPPAPAPPRSARPPPAAAPAPARRPATSRRPIPSCSTGFRSISPSGS